MNEHITLLVLFSTLWTAIGVYVVVECARNIRGEHRWTALCGLVSAALLLGYFWYHAVPVFSIAAATR